MLKFKKKLKYLIASNKLYYERSLPIILSSLLNNEISLDDIIITICNCEENFVYDKYQTFCVPYNSFEYSALINLSEINYGQSEYVFLLHDTMFCGHNFKFLSNQFNYGEKVILAHEKGWTNMGAYKSDYIVSIKSHLSNYKNISKFESVQIEGNFFNCKPSFYLNPTSYNLYKSKDVYNTGTKRIVDYYNSVDVTKFGANGLKELQERKFINEL